MDDEPYSASSRRSGRPDSASHDALEPLARELASIRTPMPPRSKTRCARSAALRRVGADLIEAGTTAQMEGAMRLPVSVGGALMPDAHLGYGLPVAASSPPRRRHPLGRRRGHRLPHAPCPYTTVPPISSRSEGDLTEVLLRNTNFGAGSKFKEAPPARALRSSTTRVGGHGFP
jgi:tRNA-splicing ligase RtcB